MKTLHSRANFSDLLSATPIDRNAAIVTGQAGCTDGLEQLPERDLMAMKDRMERKHRLLKHVLGIRSKTQHKNLMHKWNKGLPQFRQRHSRAFVEYVCLGRQIQDVTRELSVARRARQFVAYKLGAPVNPKRAAQLGIGGAA